jgi:hypothetical protein
MVILSGITTAWPINPLEERLFHRELPAQGRGIYQSNDYSAGNCPLKDKKFTEEITFRQKLQTHR